MHAYNCIILILPKHTVLLSIWYSVIDGVFNDLRKQAVDRMLRNHKKSHHKNTPYVFSDPEYQGD